MVRASENLRKPAAKAGDECTTQKGATWGIVRTSEVDRTQYGIYEYGAKVSGEGVTAYIIDTGIGERHSHCTITH